MKEKASKSSDWGTWQHLCHMVWTSLRMVPPSESCHRESEIGRPSGEEETQIQSWVLEETGDADRVALEAYDG